MFILYMLIFFFFFFKQKTAYEMRISDWSSDVCSSDLLRLVDEVAAYDSALWYLGRIGCARKVHCSAEAEAQLQAASLSASLDERMARVARAEALIDRKSVV